MSWWPFRRKPKALPIPRFRPEMPPPASEPKPEPVEVNELHEFMSRTGIHKTWDKWRERLK